MPFAPRAPNPLPCLVYRPAKHKPLGVLLFLHGSEECGTDARLPLRTGLPVWLEAEPDRWPFVVVVPQKPDKHRPWHHYETAVLAHLDQAMARSGLSRLPVVVTGISQGGHGALHLGARNPDRFAAVVALCGFASFPPSPSDAAEEAQVAMLAIGLAGQCTRLFHGEEDSAVPADKSRAVHAALHANGADSTLTLFPNTDHNCWDQAYGRSELPEWLAARLSSHGGKP